MMQTARYNCSASMTRASACGKVSFDRFRFSGFVSDEGSLGADGTDHDVVIVTYWRSFEQHERSHADAVFREKFGELARVCSETKELGYHMLLQGAPEGAPVDVKGIAQPA